MKKRSIRIVIALGVLTLFSTGCANNGQRLDPPNADNNPSRIVTKASDPRGGTDTPNTGTFENAVQLTYYSSGSSGINRDGLSDVRVARDTSNAKRIRIEAPQLANGQSICVITGAQYSADVCGYGSYFTDIGEERCGAPTAGQITFDLIRSDYNVVTVIYRDDLTQYENWSLGTVNSAAYPALAQDQIDTAMTPPACN